MTIFEVNNQTDLIKAFDVLSEFSQQEQFTDANLVNGKKTHQALNDALLSVFYASGWNSGGASLNSVTKVAVVSAMNDFRRRNVGRLTKIKSGRNEFPVHRFWLAAYSATVRRELLHTPTAPIMWPDWYPKTVVDQVIEFVYTGSMTLNAEWLDVVAVIDVAKRLDLRYLLTEATDWLKNECTMESWIEIKDKLDSLQLFDEANCVIQAIASRTKEELNETNWWESYQRVNKGSSTEMLNVIIDYLSSNFAKLPFAHLSQILSSKNLLVDSEEDVAEFILEWVAHSSGDRQYHLKKLLMSCVEMPSLSLQFVRDKLLSVPEVLADGELQLHCRWAKKVIKDANLLNDPKVRSQFPPLHKSATERRGQRSVCAGFRVINSIPSQLFGSSLQPIRKPQTEVDKLRESAHAGNATAQHSLGVRYRSGQGVPKSDEEAVKWFRKAAVQGHADAQNELGLMYKNGQGVAQSDRQAVVWCRKASVQRHAGAQNNLGVMYKNGEGVPQSDQEAVRLFRSATEQGNVAALTNLGWMYENGRGVVKSDAEAVKYYRIAAEKGHANSQKCLGVMYETGKGVQQSYEEAAKWYRKAADQGHGTAQNNLGSLYLNGQGVAKSDVEAVKWFVKAVAQNEASGSTNLGLMYENGRGVAQSDTEAVKYYSAAAEKGHARGQRCLAAMYQQGRGVQKSNELALMWLRRADEQ